jgi:hypothetical protein
MRTCSPVAIAGHALACAGVGASKDRSNQSRTAGVKEDSGNSSFEGTPPVAAFRCG